MQLIVDLQNPYKIDEIPALQKIHAWILSSLKAAKYPHKHCEITIRVVNQAESQQLNYNYRNKNHATNVLSFAFAMPTVEIPALDVPALETSVLETTAMEMPEAIQLSEQNFLGDLVICHDILLVEAKQQNKNLQNHWAHMLVHGVLHLLGFDHLTDDQANKMETLEIKILQQHAIDNPYLS